MFTIRSHARASLPTTSRLCFSCRRRYARKTATAALGDDILHAATPVAERLADTKNWHYTLKRSQKLKIQADRHRVNVVNEKLCDDILNYVKPSLQRHIGCDILDLNPGAGLWSSKLHDLLQPRSHIMMEPDDELYRPFLTPLLAKPNTTLVPKAGFDWKELDKVLTPTYFPHQTARDPSSSSAAADHPQRNDTLLVTANLTQYPKRKYHAFEGFTQLLLHQFISAIRTEKLFHRYGLVRMLLWVADDDKKTIVPRSVQQRRRMAMDAEMATDWVAELAGADVVDPSQKWYQRDQNIDAESVRNVLRRMRENGIVIPPGRETLLAAEAVAGEELAESAAPSETPSSSSPVQAGKRAAAFLRPFQVNLQELEDEFARGAFGKDSPKYKQLQARRWRLSASTVRTNNVLELLTERDALVALHTAVRDGDDSGAEELVQREAAWHERIQSMAKDPRAAFVLARDNLHVFRQDPPVLSWDRRPFEPLAVRPDEFFPNVPCCLLDVQPKAMHPLLRAPTTGSGSSSGGGLHSALDNNVYELLRSTHLSSPEPVSHVLAAIYPGMVEGVLPHCPSLLDPQRGGTPLRGRWGELSMRSLNERQFVEIMQGWTRWEAKPSFVDLLSRVADMADARDDEDSGGGATNHDSLI